MVRTQGGGIVGSVPAGSQRSVLELAPSTPPAGHLVKKTALRLLQHLLANLVQGCGYVLPWLCRVPEDHPRETSHCAICTTASGGLSIR